MTEKDNLELKVKVTGIPEPTVRWYQNDREVASTLKIKVSKSDDVHSVVIQQVSQTHVGQYKCVASNTHGTVEHVASVTVTGTKLHCLTFLVRCAL